MSLKKTCLSFWCFFSRKHKRSFSKFLLQVLILKMREKLHKEINKNSKKEALAQVDLKE